jgi:hypothetical protein
MRCSKSEFLTAIQGWHESPCTVHLHTNEISGALIATLNSASPDGVLQFSAHPVLEPLTIDLCNADEFEFVLPDREVGGADSELVSRVADQIALARVAGKLVLSMTRLVDPFAGTLAKIPSRPLPKTGAAEAEPPVEEESPGGAALQRCVTVLPARGRASILRLIDFSS